jgi:hypothetical protein
VLEGLKEQKCNHKITERLVTEESITTLRLEEKEESYWAHQAFVIVGTEVCCCNPLPTNSYGPLSMLLKLPGTLESGSRI